MVPTEAVQVGGKVGEETRGDLEVVGAGLVLPAPSRPLVYRALNSGLYGSLLAEAVRPIEVVVAARGYMEGVGVVGKVAGVTTSQAGKGNLT